MAIEWAPLLDIPLHRRIEVCAAAFQISITAFGEIIALIFLVWCLVRKHLLQSNRISLINYFCCELNYICKWMTNT